MSKVTRAAIALSLFLVGLWFFGWLVLDGPASWQSAFLSAAVIIGWVVVYFVIWQTLNWIDRGH